VELTTGSVATYRKPVGLLLGPDHQFQRFHRQLIRQANGFARRIDTIVTSQQVLIEEITDGFD
jgi:hypothetical protein